MGTCFVTLVLRTSVGCCPALAWHCPGFEATSVPPWHLPLPKNPRPRTLAPCPFTVLLCRDLWPALCHSAICVDPSPHKGSRASARTITFLHMGVRLEQTLPAPQKSFVWLQKSISCDSAVCRLMGSGAPCWAASLPQHRCWLSLGGRGPAPAARWPGRCSAASGWARTGQPLLFRCPALASAVILGSAPQNPLSLGTPW